MAFTAPANLDEFLRSVAMGFNGVYQDADGQRRFLVVPDQTSSFTFNEQNIVRNTLRTYPRYSQEELRNLPNRFVFDGRDLDSRYLENFDPPVYYDVPWLQEIAGRVIEETVPGAGSLRWNTRRWQALENLQHWAKLRTANKVVEFEGMPNTYPVLPGDVVTLSHAHYGISADTFLVLEATDKSFDKGGAERIFRLIHWS
jgi:hypothetical protein